MQRIPPWIRNGLAAAAGGFVAGLITTGSAKAGGAAAASAVLAYLRGLYIPAPGKDEPALPHP